MTRNGNLTNKPIAILVAGPLSLFRTTGIYYLRELLRTFDVVLVGWKDYAGDKAFEIASAWPGVIETHLIPPAWEPLAYHRASAAFAEDLAVRIRPAVLLQHNDCYPHNLYFIRGASRLQGVLRATYANGLTIDHAADARFKRADQIAEIVAQHHIPRFTAVAVFWVRSFLRHLIRFVLLPVLVGELPLWGHTDLDTGRINFRNTAGQNDLHLIYSEYERNHYERSLQPAAVEIIRHPMSVTGGEVNKAIDMPEALSRIAFLPTNALISLLSARIGADRAIASMAQAWTSALLILKERLGGVPIVAKLHPGSARDPLMASVLQEIRISIPGIEVIDPGMSAERLVLGSTCVISDVSTVLWWARMAGGRNIISLDAWNIPGGGEFSHYPGIVYVRNPEDLWKANLDPLGVSDMPYPTLIEALNQRLQREAA